MCIMRKEGRKEGLKMKMNRIKFMVICVKLHNLIKRVFVIYKKRILFSSKFLKDYAMTLNWVAAISS